MAPSAQTSSNCYSSKPISEALISFGLDLLMAVPIAVGGVRLSALTSPGAIRRRSGQVRCSAVGQRGLAEQYRTLRLQPGATRDEVKKAFRRLALKYHPDARKESDSGAQFQQISLAYQMVMRNLTETEERLEHWRCKYGLTDEDLQKYSYDMNDFDEWFEL